MCDLGIPPSICPCLGVISTIYSECAPLRLWPRPHHSAVAIHGYPPIHRPGRQQIGPRWHFGAAGALQPAAKLWNCVDAGRLALWRMALGRGEKGRGGEATPGYAG